VRLGYSAGVASSVIVVPVMALETRAVHPRVLGSFLELLRGDARHNSSHGQLDAGDVWRIEVTSARVSSEVGGVPSSARTFDSAILKQAE
jgi:hypothetical protein